MYNIYLGCFVVGLALLFLSLIANGITDLFHGLLAMDFNSDALSGFIPISPLEACAFSVAFGGMGLTFYPHTTYHLWLAILSGFILSLATKWLLKFLKQVDSSTVTDMDLLGMEGTVLVTIFEKGVGSVSLDTKLGKVTYSAKSHKTIAPGTSIKVIAVVNHILTVTPTADFPASLDHTFL